MAVVDTQPDSTAVRRLRVRVRGAVQGVGFRPFCARLADEASVTGWVRNDGLGAQLEVQGPAAALDAFMVRLVREAPPLARVQSVERDTCPALPLESAFVIAPSTAPTTSATLVPPDAATCPACLRELFDPRDRRFRYPFINCTHCGPRWTITRRLPYDRPFTSLADFPLCDACAAEYGDAHDRRFHAQPNACAVCGPHLQWLDADGALRAVPDVLALAADRLRAGAVLAIKGLGGFHLVCDARHGDTLARMRQSKLRATKPFALMCLNAASADLWVRLDDAARHLLESTERPIVLVDKRPTADHRLPGVAPGVAELGVMLPYTPLHWLLFHELLGRPEGTTWLDAANELVLVMTSANPGGEPLVIGNDEAVARLQGLADAFVVHDRPIVSRCDDSVVRAGGADDVRGSTHPDKVARAVPRFVRRARGYVPVPIPLPGVPSDAPPVLACGAWLKNTVCVTRGDEAFLSPHIGDLGSAASCAALDEAVARLTAFLDVEPRRVLHDLHPDFYSTRFAISYAQANGIDCVGVQHHHAHIAAVCAEFGVHAPVLGIALDGVGLGTDGTAWGGELLRVEGASMQRVGHFAPIVMPGGDAAAREPWRVAAGLLFALGRGTEIPARFGHHAAASIVTQMLARDLRCVRTTSAGRVFDAAAALLGVAELNRHESEAAMALEAAAIDGGSATPLHDGWRVDAGVLDLLPLFDYLASVRTADGDDTRTNVAAAVFHATLARAIADWAAREARSQRIATVALAGGCWLNRLLRATVVEQLARDGFNVLEPVAAPPNDGGIALGQAWVGLQQLVNV